MKVFKLILLIVVVAIIGVVVGSVVRNVQQASPSGAVMDEPADSVGEETPPTLYVCPRHPQEVKTTPGHCSICGSRLEVMV